MSRTQYNLKIQQDQKSRWMEAVDESDEYDSLSHLIRLSVESELNSSDTRPTETPEDSGEILGSLNRVENGLSDLQERMGALEREAESEAKFDIQRVLYELLPEGEPRSAGEGTDIPELARRIGAEPSDVRAALESLDESYAAVKSVTHAPPDGSEPRTIYYRTGGSH